MNPVAKKIGQVVAGFGLLFAAALAFQNCSGYAVLDSSQTNLPSSCSGGDCGQQTVEGLNLKTTNQFINLAGSTLSPRVIDVAGFCDDANFPSSEVYYQWLNGSSAVTPWSKSNSGCDDLGRFSVRAIVPAFTGTLDVCLWIQIPLADGSYLPASTSSIKCVTVQGIN